MDQNVVFNGLGTFSTTIVAAGDYFVEGKISLPSLVGGSSAASAVVAVVNQNGSPVYTGVAGATGFRVDLACAVNDTIAIVLSSAAAVDNQLNAVKATFAIAQGV